MKKHLALGFLLLCTIGCNEVYGEEQSMLEEKNTTEKESSPKESYKQITKEFIGRSDVEKERERQQRSLRYSSLEASGLYANIGDILVVEVTGQELLELVIGTPERNTPQSFSLKKGKNVINAEIEGAIYIKNPNNQGSSIVEIVGATGDMPYFDLNKTSNKEFDMQMEELVDAKDVQLISNKAIITVSYEQAKKYIDNPKELMEYYDQFLEAQDRVSGINNNGKPVNHVDRHFQHYVEVSRDYMYAVQEYMGFNGDAALSRLLKTDNGWGVWHESGHQRQQSPWNWSAVTEATVNIYSMAAQKELTGSVTALDSYYPQMHEFLKSENKNFQIQNDNLKMVMFGQLANTFGEAFYPILHQYYREHKISYTSDSDRIQNFILSVSTITGYNMTNYFEQWGFNIADKTKIQMMKFPDLPESIWLNDNNNIKKLPLRLINKVELSDAGVNVSLTNFEVDVFQNQKLVVKKNNQYISELSDYSSLFDSTWQTETLISSKDIIEIEVINDDGVFQLYKGSILGDQLKREILEYLNSKESLHEILSQSILNDFRSRIDALNDENYKKNVLNLLEKLEEMFLESLVKGMSFNQDGVLKVEFSNSKFTEYNKLVILGTDKYIAEISNGQPYYGSLSGNTLTVYELKNQINFSVQFRLPHKTYTVSKISTEELLLKNDIENLFTENNSLKENVNQSILDELRDRITLLSGKLVDELTKKVENAQHLLFESIIGDITITNNRVSVEFLNDSYKNYKIVILEDKKYMAEVTNGNPYYGSLTNGKFTPSANAKLGSLYEVEVRHSSGNYTIRENKFD